MLIDTFINAVYLYDNKIVIGFNHKEGTQTVTFDEVKEAIPEENGSDLDCLGASSALDESPGRFSFLCVGIRGGMAGISIRAALMQEGQCGR